ncbi:MAG TPA: NADH-quinone oxidoreductase subunit C [Candidatus Thermoplasmatota archaeon]|nr:NADH-quinone oxidoreductase subunit C [Candidatus Thermoplasmatota archaeon]
MALPDSGNPADYSPEQIEELLRADKATLTKNQKAAVARHNFQKSKAAQAAAAPEGAPAAPAPTTGAAAPAAAPQAAKPPPAPKPAEDKVAKARESALAFPYATALRQRFADTVEDLVMQKDKPCLVVKPDAVADVLAAARSEGFVHLALLTAADYPPDRIEAVYTLYDPAGKRWLAAKARLSRAAPRVASVSSLWGGAVWLEREVYDMFGVHFDGLADHRRLLLPEGWTGFPLLKDYDSTKEQYIAIGEDGEDLVSFEEAKGW